MATYTDAIQKLYVAYFSRPADPAGLAYWEDVVTAAKGDTSAVSAAFAASTEYQTAYAQVNVSGVLSQIYLNLFGHPADAPGLAYWIKAIGDKEFTIDQAVTKIAAGAQGADKVAFEQKVVVATSFTAAVDTDAEKAGYKGTDANKAAKDFLATIKTAADAEAALKVLDTKVADVIKAGVPFTVAGALKALADAKAAEAAFLAASDGDNNPDTSDTAVTLGTAVKNKATAVGNLVDPTNDAYNKATSDGVKAALLADKIDQNATDLAKAQKAADTAIAAADKTVGLTAAIAGAKAADAALTAANVVVGNAQVDLEAAVGKYKIANKAGVTVDLSNGGVVAGLIKLAADGKTPVLVNDVTETTNPGITAVLKTIVSALAAVTAAKNADAASKEATFILSNTDVDHTVANLDKALIDLGKGMTVVKIATDAMPTGAQILAETKGLAAIADATAKAVLAAGDDVTQDQKDAAEAAAEAVTDFKTLFDAFDGIDKTDPLSAAVIAKTGAVKTITDSIKALSDAVAKLAAANANVDQYDGLHKAVTDAEKTFTDHKMAVPVTLATYNVGTSADDIFVAGKINSTVTDMSKTDKLFIGADYVLNTGDLKAGNNAALEIFLKQVGANTEVTVETKAYGSESHDTITITLVGVSAADVHFDGGIVTV